MLRIAVGFLILALLAVLLGFGVGTDYAREAGGLLVVVFVVLAGVCILGRAHIRSRLSRDKTNLTRLSAWRATKKLQNSGTSH